MIVLNAIFAFAGEAQAEKAVEALRRYLPQEATVRRDGRTQRVDACQVGTAVAARTERASLAFVGFFTNPLLLWGIVIELLFAALVAYAPPLQRLFGTASLGLMDITFLVPFPVIVWGADELRRHLLRRRAAMPSKASGQSTATLVT